MPMSSSQTMTEAGESSLAISQAVAQPSRLRRVPMPGKNFRHEILVAMAAQGHRGARLEWMKIVGGDLQRTLQRLLGPAAPHELLLEGALFAAATSWPDYRGEEPVSIWAQRVAARVALTYLSEANRPAESLSGCFAGARPGGVREVVAALYVTLRQRPPEEHVAFALLELDGRSLSEAAAVLRLPPMVVRQRAGRVHRHLLFAARGDRLIAKYVRIASRLRAFARRWDHGVTAETERS
jgi:DNA-directed RNA polymerase specialized sigma24 family protein